MITEPVNQSERFTRVNTPDYPGAYTAQEILSELPNLQNLWNTLREGRPEYANHDDSQLLEMIEES